MKEMLISPGILQQYCYKLYYYTHEDYRVDSLKKSLQRNIRGKQSGLDWTVKGKTENMVIFIYLFF